MQQSACANPAGAPERQVIHNTQPCQQDDAPKPTPVYTCVHGDNSDLIAEVVRKYVDLGDSILDPTYGKGIFWRKCDPSNFTLVTADLNRPAQVRCDFRHMPFVDGAFHHTVFDPPYVHHGRNMILRSRYNNDVTTGAMDHNAIMETYRLGMLECVRVTREKGFVWVKCQDEVENGCQRLSCLEITMMGLSLGLCVRDTFVLYPKGKPILQHARQQHARKNHSSLIILEKASLKKWRRQTAFLRRIVPGFPDQPWGFARQDNGPRSTEASQTSSRAAAVVIGKDLKNVNASRQ